MKDQVKRAIGQCIPIKDLNWSSETIESALQNQEQTIHLLNDSKWTLSFLKFLISHAESLDIPIHDCLYQKLTAQCLAPNPKTIIKKYWINQNENVAIEEDLANISNGNTGLRTWQASLSLLDYISTNPSTIKNLHIFELGSGKTSIKKRVRTSWNRLQKSITREISDINRLPRLSP